MTDPTPFLSTAIQTSAGMVAIVGGLLVARFISLESEQQGVDQMINETEGRLTVAQKRLQDAREAFHRFEAEDFLDDDDVLGLIADGITNVDELRRQGTECGLTNDELSLFVLEYRTEYERAFHVLDNAIHDPGDIRPGSLDPFRDFDRIRRDIPTIPVDVARPNVWEVALNRIIDRYEQAARERTRRDRRVTERLGIPGIPALPPGLAISQSMPPDALKGIRPHWWASRRDALGAAVVRAEQRVEDVDFELEQLRLKARAIVMPDKQLWQALFVLGVLSVFGVLIPMWMLSRGPSHLDALIRSLFWPFLISYVLLVGYLIQFALRLSRSRRWRDNPF